MVTRGLSERRALTVVRMSAAALRYTPRPDQDAGLRDRIVALAHRHRRYGAGMIYLKLRQEGRVVNHKRVDRLYAEARLQVKRRRRKKVPVADRQPLLRPQRRNEVWSADFVFDRTAEGRVLKCLTIVDDATTEAVAIVPARALGGRPVTRVLEQLAASRGLPQVLRTDNGPEFCGRAHAHVGARARPHAAADRTGQADAERVHRIVQRPLPRRMPQRALVHQPGPCASRDRDVATGIQRGTTEEATRRADARRLCQDG